MIPSRLAVGPARSRGRADVVVVGSGAAGLSAALALADGGAAVTVVTKDRLGDGATAWAQGGLAAVCDPADRIGDHVQDTLVAGAGLCDALAVSALAAAAPAAVDALAGLGVAFDRTGDGRFALGLEGGHRARRIVHAGGDATGAAVVAALVGAVRASGAVTVLPDTLAVDALCDDDGAVRGLRALGGDGAVLEIAAGAVVLATGGIGQAWPLTSNPASATGDGLALALRAGATVRDAEFVQFHPTVLVAPGGQRTALISEAVRGEGARLIDAGGAPVMDGEHPLGDLAPRDVVAAAIHRRMTRTRTDHVLLDATGFEAATWHERFPTILALCLARGVDPRTAPMPVAPAAHYACGGVLADLDGTTSVPGLSAIGEVASTGVQGANRLASNGVTEAVIAGGRVAQRLLDDGVAPPARGPAAAGGFTALLDAAARPAIVAATGAGCGVLRDAAGLSAQLDALDALGARPPRASVTRRAAAPAGGPRGTLRAAVEASNLHAVSTLVATAALRRTESRGAHRRADFPDTSPDWHAHQRLQLCGGELCEARVAAAVAA